jgi:hypothetical protein
LGGTVTLVSPKDMPILGSPGSAGRVTGEEVGFLRCRGRDWGRARAEEGKASHVGGWNLAAVGKGVMRSEVEGGVLVAWVAWGGWGRQC